MKKLELKHIAPYLPYGLKCSILNYKSDYVGIEKSTINGYYFIGSQLHLTYDGGSTGKVMGNEIAIYLRPLSDLTKPEFKMDDISKGAIMFLDETANLPHNSRDSHIGSIQWVDMKKLFEWHFDVFGLIPQELAIDINTLKDD